MTDQAPAPPQEHFLEAVVGDRRMSKEQKIDWLFRTAADYWARLEAITPVLRELEVHLDPTGTPRDDSGLHELHERVVAALRVASGVGAAGVPEGAGA